MVGTIRKIRAEGRDTPYLALMLQYKAPIKGQGGGGLVGHNRALRGIARG